MIAAKCPPPRLARWSCGAVGKIDCATTKPLEISQLSRFAVMRLVTQSQSYNA